MLKTPKEIKRDILSKFRSQFNDLEQADSFEKIPSNLLFNDYWQLLTIQEKGNFNKAVSDLRNKGLIHKVNGKIPSLRLTDKGADLIY